MSVSVPTASGVKNQAGDNAAPALVGSGGIVLGQAVLGPSLGPIAGGTVAGAALDGTEADMVTLFGMMQGMTNFAGGGATSSSRGGSRGRM